MSSLRSATLVGLSFVLGAAVGGWQMYGLTLFNQHLVTFTAQNTAALDQTLAAVKASCRGADALDPTATMSADEINQCVSAAIANYRGTLATMGAGSDMSLMLASTYLAAYAKDHPRSSPDDPRLRLAAAIDEAFQREPADALIASFTENCAWSIPAWLAKRKVRTVVTNTITEHAKVIDQSLRAVRTAS